MQASPSLPLHDHPQMLLLLAGPAVARERHLHHLHLPLLRGEYVISNLTSSLFIFIHGTFLWPTPYAYLFISPLSYLFIYLFITSWQSNIRKILLPPTLSYLTSLSWRYISPLCMHFHCHVLPCVLSPFSLSFIIFFLHAYLSAFNIYLFSSSFFSFFFFFYAFRLTSSPFLFITP